MTANSKRTVVPRLAELSKLGRHSNGIDRGLATSAERGARELFATWARASGRTLSQDRVGNLFARRSGTNANASAILVGSHLDTVPTGGAYDGAYGVVGALCALDLLDERGHQLSHSVDAVAWAGEEGSRFPLGCLGSSVFAGMTGERTALALTDEAGTTLASALASAEGGLLEDVPFRERVPVAAYLELHVEQGPVLEQRGVRLGVVTAIAAQRRYRATVAGSSGHAGTVPMEMRSDALCAAAELILLLETSARDAGGAVATVGRLTLEPNGTNVIPERVVFSIDIRSADEARLDGIERALHACLQRLAEARNVLSTIETLEARSHTPMDPSMMEAIRRAAATLGEPSIDVPSGAGHDAMCLATIAPAGMIFVPSAGGRSHVHDEHTDDEDLELGVAALAQTLFEVDRSIP